MDLKFIESGKAGYKVVEFRGVGVAYKEVIDSKREGGGVMWWRKSIGVEVSE
jgi:hypothetical protein